MAGALGQTYQQRCLQQFPSGFHPPVLPFTWEGAAFSGGRLAERRCEKGILNKGAGSNFDTEWARGGDQPAEPYQDF